MPAQVQQRESAARAVGFLKFLSDDWRTWHFQSTDNPNVFHTVDLAEWECSGKCSCPHFEMRIEPLLRERVIRPHESRAKCKHIRRAEALLCYRVKKSLFARTRNPKENER